MDDRCVLFFMKYPEEGQVKTRLAKDIGAVMAFELYKNFVVDVLSVLEKIDIHFWICFYPADSRQELAKWLGEQHHYVPQSGEDLGERMKNGFIRAFAAGYRRVIITGSDIPDLPGGFIKEAFSSLQTDDTVIGPAPDGGYYLIGFRSDTFLPEAFAGITWSTNTVFGETMNILVQSGRKIHILPEWSDVDTLDDLRKLVKRNQDTEFRNSKTIACILQNEEAFK